MASSTPPVNPDQDAIAAADEPSTPSAAAPSTPPAILHLSFSHDASCFVVATASSADWFCCNTFKRRYHFQETDARRTIAAAAGDMRDEKMSACAVVTSRPTGCEYSRPKYTVRRWTPGFINYTWRYEDKAIEATAQVRAVCLRRSHTVLVHDRHVVVYDVPSKGVLHWMETALNPLGLCAVSQEGVAPFAFACPGRNDGEVQVELWEGEREPLCIPAHGSRLACLALSPDGRLLATASIKGTLVRVFSACDGTLLRELRRGADRAEIHSIAFSADSQWLAVSSCKGTIHVFSVDVHAKPPTSYGGDNPDNLPATPSPSRRAPNANQSSSLSFMKGVLPKYFSSEWSLAQFRLREGPKYLVAFGQEPNTIVVIGMDGSFYRCQFDPVRGGEMKQLEYRNFMNLKSRSDRR